MRVLVLAALFAVAYAKHEKYIGWKSYYVGVSNVDQAKAFGSMIGKYELDILSHPILEREGVVLVNPEEQAAFIQDIEAEGIKYRIHTDDIKSRLDYDDSLIEMQKTASRTRNGGRQMPYDNYQEIEVINDYLDYIGSEYPDLATVVTAAHSFEGRPIKYIKISTTNFTDVSKPVIFIDGAIHAREWITPPTVTWAIHKLVEDVTEPDILDRFDWVLLPVVNPDGYKYSFTNDRFWRKTRSTDSEPSSVSCPGVDGDRNFDYNWNTFGTVDNPCSEIYGGTRVFSEVETRVVRDILNEHLARTALYINMHSFGSMILYPWGDGILSPNALGLHIVGVAMAKAIDQNSISYFPRYVVGNTALVTNQFTSGSAQDYAHAIGVPMVYSFQLPGLAADWEDMQGFHLEPQYIEQVCRETWESIVVGARTAGDWFRNTKVN